MATKNTSIALGAPYTDFARAKVASGDFGSASEVVREAMRRFIAEDAKLEALRAALIKGENSGPAGPFDFDSWLEERFPA